MIEDVLISERDDGFEPEVWADAIWEQCAAGLCLIDEAGLVMRVNQEFATSLSLSRLPGFWRRRNRMDFRREIPERRKADFAQLMQIFGVNSVSILIHAEARLRQCLRRSG